MDCREVSEKLPLLVGGGLAGAEQHAVRKHLRSCLACRDEWDETQLAAALFGAHLSGQALVDLAWGRAPSGIAQETARRHLEGCLTCAEDLALARESRRLDAEPEPRPATGSAVRWCSGLAAAVVVAFLAGLWWGGMRGRSAALSAEAERRRVSEQLAAAQAEAARLRGAQAELRGRLDGLAAPHLNLPVFQLLPARSGRRAAVPARNVLRIPTGAAWVVLVLGTLGAPARTARVELRDAAGALLWSGADLRPGPRGGYTLELPAALLPEGRLSLVVRSDGRPVESFPLQLRR